MRWGEKEEYCPLFKPRTVIGVMARIYDIWPWRPHCSATSHVLLCRITGRLVGVGRDDCPKPPPPLP